MNDGGTYDPTLKRPYKGPVSDLPEGLEVGEYRVLRKIGEGGMGAVYAAVHPVIGKRVAIKVLAPHVANHPELVRRFVDEARAVNKIGHPNIVDIFSFGWLPDQRHYFAMEYLEGQTLSDRLKAGPIAVDEARRLLGQICGALEAAHQVGIVHRDLKPENIWIAQPKHGDSYAKLLDFGIAKLLGDADSAPHTQTGAIMGTPAYMAPEQCRGIGVEARTDVYSVGVILYEMFTGRTPFQGSFVELITKHLSDAPEAPSRFGAVPPALERLILSCLEKEPARRPASAAALARELEAALVAVPAAPAAPPPPPAPAPAPAAGDTLSPLPGKTSPGSTMHPARTRAPLLWIGGAGVAALVVFLFLVLARPSVQPEPSATALADSASMPAAPAPAAAAGTGHVRVVAQNASNARFFIDDRLVASGAREADLPSVTPDRPHVLRVESDGLTPVERTFTVAAGGVVEIQMTLGSAPIRAPTPTPPSAPAHQATQSSRTTGTASSSPRPTAKPARHRDGLVGDDIFDKP
ncbi:MAG TPA: serine/threonine-protein kinase [Polyangia bacterium]|nr:serine/threonine-protein kinase [Polyangia bacterium]